MSSSNIDAINMSNTICKALGYEPHELQIKWRTDPPVVYDSREAMAAILDALVHEGVVAWPGDGTSKVEQMLAALHAKWVAAEKRAMAHEFNPDDR